MKMRAPFLLVSIVLSFLLLCAFSPGYAASPKTYSDKGVRAGYLRCEYLFDPLGIDETAPRLSWEVQSGQRGQRQSAYRLLVASSEDQLKHDQGDLWDSGKVESDNSLGAVYAGKALASHQRCFWKVMLWDKDGKASAWSQPALWSIGLLQANDWKAEWIGYDKPHQENRTEAASTPAQQTGQAVKKRGKAKSTTVFLPPPSYLRTQFRAEKPIARATLYASALGLADLHLNGHRVSEDFFTPGWTDYKKRVYYRTYDVSRLVRRGDNALGAVLADGWFSGYIGYRRERDNYGKFPRLRAQLHLEYTDGTTADIGTDASWKANTGAERSADFLQGETYDARLESAWSEPGCDTATWQPVVVGSEEVHPLVQAHPGYPVRAIHEFKPKAITEPKSGVYVVNLGQNFAGIARLKVSGKPGQKITLRFAERLNPDGTVYTANLRSARATDTYICKGTGTETWEPRFTFHGFQYVEITGLEKKPSTDTVTGIALSSDTPVVGEFACSDPMINQIHSNGYWTQRANFIDVPTDCPQRDERLGWTGDAQVYIRTATLNNDVQAFFKKWLVDLDTDSQRADGEFPCVAPLLVAGNDGGPAWADAGVICPWTIYSAYGDTRILERHYNEMKRFVEFCVARSTPDLLPPKSYHCFGDWLSIQADTPKDIIYMAYFAHSTQLLAEAAKVLGKTEDAEHYSALFGQICKAFTQAYVEPDGQIKGHTQTDYALALDFGLVTGEQAKQAGQHLVEAVASRDYHLSTGFLGTRSLMLALSQIGRPDVAYRLLHNTTFPSWGFSIKQGATSIWERWDGWTPEKGFQDPGMNSFAHYSFGAVYQWMFENIGGITTGDAYKSVTIAPKLDGQLTSAKVSYRSIHGLIVSDWKQEKGKLLLNVTVPANTTATVVLPAKAMTDITESKHALEQAQGVKILQLADGKAYLSVQSGKYQFTAVMP